MVAGFSQSPPNAALMQLATREWRAGRRRAIDLGCGAGRNAVPLARAGWEVFGIDSSAPMLGAALRRARGEQLTGSIRLVLAAMDHLPARGRAFDLGVAHGIWNLARSTAEFRHAVREAARVLVSGAPLFVFTFSRSTLAADARPVAGETFVFTQFSGQPQCFLTEAQLLSELGEAGLAADPAVPVRELNRPVAPALRSVATPVIFEAVFRARGSR